MTYESVRKYLTPEGDKNPSPYRKLLAGAISGAVAQTCTYPLLVLLFYLLSLAKPGETDYSLVMYYVGASRSTQCLEWVTNTPRSGML
jgi:hypothetical protein